MSTTGSKEQAEVRGERALLKGKAEALEQRCIQQVICELYGYQTGSYKGQPAEISNYRGPDGNIVSQHVRYGNKKFTWINRHDDISLFGSHLGSEGRLILTEGQIDAMSVFQAMEEGGHLYTKMPTTVCSITDGAGGGLRSIEANIKYILGFKEVVLFFDQDEPGKKAAVEAVKIIGPKTKVVSRFTYKDANEALQAGDLGALTVAVREAAIVRPRFVQPAQSLLEGVLRPVDRTGMLFPWESWNGLTGMTPRTLGMRPGEVWTLTGGTGLGKSVFARAIAVNAATHHDTKVAFIPLEETCERSLELMLSQVLGYRVDQLSVSDRLQKTDEITHAVQLLDQIIFVNQFGGSNFDDFVNTVKHLVLAEGCKLIVLDHFSMLADGIDMASDQRRAIDRCMKRLKELTVELGFSLLMLCHLSRSEGQAAEEGGRPQLQHLRGSHSIAQVSDFVVALQRNPLGDDSNVTNCWLLKNRVFGQVGQLGSMTYNPGTAGLQEQPIFGTT